MQGASAEEGTYESLGALQACGQVPAPTQCAGGAVFPCPAPCLFESPVPESGLFQTQLTAPRGSWKKQGGQDEIKCGEPICLAELDVSHISLYLTLPPIPGGIKV